MQGFPNDGATKKQLAVISILVNMNKHTEAYTSNVGKKLAIVISGTLISLALAFLTERESY
jgi:hypothetical protein